MTYFRILASALLFGVAGLSPALSHELWIDAEAYQVESGTPLRASLRNGQNFSGIDLAWFDARIAVFDLVEGSARVALKGRAGDIPAVQTTVADDGLVVLAYQSTPSTLNYATWEKFEAFVTHKDFGDVAARHRARGLPEKEFQEVYTRYSKALVAVGDGAGADAPVGFETEFVALANPYTDDLSGGLPVALTYQGQPRVDVQVEIFDRPPEGDVVVTYTRTDATGHAVIPVQAGHVYLLDAVVLREPSAAVAEKRGVVWESLWAALTFQVPAQ